MNPRHVLAIARLTLRDACRSRMLPSVLFMLVLAIAGLPWLITDSASGTGRLFILLRYSMATALFILTVTTLWASCGAVAGDIADRRIHLVLAKPVRRTEFWAGKWLGITAMNAILLAVSGVLVWAMLHFSLNRLAPDAPERIDAASRLLTARHALIPDLPPEILRRIGGREKALRSDPSARHSHPHSIAETAREEVIRGSMLVPPMGSIEIHFSHVPAFTGSQRAELRCTMQTSRPEGRFVSGTWRIRSRSGESVDIPFTNRPGIPARLLIPPFPRPADSLSVTLQRTDTTSAAHLLLAPHGAPPELLVPSGAFGPNLARTLLALLFRLCFVAAIGVTMGCLLSTPVSAFSGLALLIILHMTGFVTGVASSGALLVNHHGEAVAAQGIDRIVLQVLLMLNRITGPLAQLDPLPLLADGRIVSSAFTWTAFGLLGLAYTLAAALPGMLLFARRELP